MRKILFFLLLLPVLLIGVCAVSAHDVDPISAGYGPYFGVDPIADDFRPDFNGNIDEIPPYYIEPVSPDTPLFKIKDYPTDLETLLEMYGIRPISHNNVSDNVVDDYVDVGNVTNDSVPVVDDSSVDLDI